MTVLRDYGGRIPSDPAALRELPGVGRYTAHAVACFGHRERHAVVDINIRRVLSRLTHRMADTAAMLPEAEAWRIAEDLLPARAFYNWNQGMMDLGARICTARMPACARCPLRGSCASAGKLSAPPPALRAHVRETPRRIYRGRVVELLRRSRDHCSSAGEIGRQLFETFGPEQHPGLLDILATLEADGMIAVRSQRKTVTDIRSYSGALARLRICLVE
jgi:A/G-specific adenine glycosylase